MISVAYMNASIADGTMHGPRCFEAHRDTATRTVTGSMATILGCSSHGCTIGRAIGRVFVKSQYSILLLTNRQSRTWILWFNNRRFIAKIFRLYNLLSILVILAYTMRQCKLHRAKTSYRNSHLHRICGHQPFLHKLHSRSCMNY